MTSSSTCPGKAFLCGEYSVLFGGTALVAAAGPRFALRVNGQPAAGSVSGIVLGTPEGGTLHVRGVPPGSPAARWMEIWIDRACLRERLELVFEDPLNGAGGFGASTAQFALIARELGGKRDWPQIWREYRVLHEEEEIPPSGADLAVQLHGGVVAFSFSDDGPRVRPTALIMPGTALALFSATERPGRKVRTHEHLRSLGRAGLRAALPEAALEALASLTEQAVSAAGAGDADAGRRFGDAISSYARALAELGLEAAGAAEDRAALSKIPGVLGTKGTGALLADGVLVACREDSLAGVVTAAEARGLRVMEAPLRSDAKGWSAE